MSGLQGIFTALLTPFDENDEIDAKATEALVEFQVKLGVQGLYVGGSSAEAMAQSVDERERFLGLVAAANANRLSLIAHVGTVATKDSHRLAAQAHRTGYHAISAITPYYYPFSRAEVMAHYTEIADHSALPLIIYNFPAIAAPFTMPELGTLLAHPNIIGIKHTATDMFTLERLRRHHPEAVIYNGYDEMCLAGLATGAQGAIGTTYNFMGDLFVALAAHVSRGELAEARRLQSMANVVIERLVEFGVMPSSKMLLDIMGVPVGVSRMPFRRVSVEQKVQLEQAAASLLAWRKAGHA